MPDETGGIIVRDHRGQSRRHVELRDPAAATGNLGYRARGMPMVPEWDATSAVRFALYANTIVFRCVQVTANALSRVPFRVGADPTKPHDYDPRAPLARLLGPAPGGPNVETSARQLWAWTVAQYLVTGRFGWENELNALGRPVALWPLPASSLRPIPTASGARYFDQFKFGPQGPDEKTLRPDQIVYGWRPSAHDWREPESALQAARMDISVAVMQDRYDYAFLRNGARPDFLVVHEAFEDPDQTDAFRNQFNAEHRGPDNAGKPAFVESVGGGEQGVTGAIDVKQLGLSQKDAQAIQRYEQKVRAICLALGTPLSKLGDSSDRTFSNAGQEDRNWYGETVQPLGDELSDVVNIKLAPRLGDNVGWFDWSTVPALRPERRFQVANPVELVAAGVVDDDEVRADLELPARPEGTEDTDPDEGVSLLPKAQAFAALVAAGLTQASAALMTGLDVTAVEVAPVAPVVVPAQAAPARVAEGDFPGGPLPTFVKKPAAHSYKPGQDGRCVVCGMTKDTKGHKLPDGTFRTAEDITPEPVEDREAIALSRRDTRWSTVDRRATALEKTWQRGMVRMFTRQQEATLTRLTGKRGRQMLTAALAAAGQRVAEEPAPQVDPSAVFDQDYWTADTEELTAGLYETVASVAGSDVAERFGAAFDVDAMYVQDFITARAHDLAGQVTQTTYDAIRRALAQGVADGASIDDLATAVRHVFDVATTARAEMIARTEVISAYNGAATLEAAQLPADVVAGKEWVSTRDDRVREAHAEADGQTVTMDGNFTVGGEDVAYPGDGSAENSINCRCTVAFLTPDEMPTDRVARRVDERAARAAFRIVRAGWLDPEDLETRLGVSA